LPHRPAPAASSAGPPPPAGHPSKPPNTASSPAPTTATHPAPLPLRFIASLHRLLCGQPRHRRLRLALGSPSPAPPWPAASAPALTRWQLCMAEEGEEARGGDATEGRGAAASRQSRDVGRL
jgi:hypothetical protein